MGTTKLNRLEENVGAADVELSAEDLRDSIPRQRRSQSRAHVIRNASNE
jgi:aryl-alcohol dehydrogenase-like predicted oxidoreductase